MTPDPIAEERSRRLRAAFLNHDFGGAGKVLESAEFGNVVEDKQTFLMSSAVAGWAGSALGRRVNPAAPDWQGIKDGIARGFFKNQAASNVSDQDLFSMIAADYQAQDKIAQMARQAASRGESWLSKFRELEGAEAGNILPGRLPNYLGLARAAHDEMRDKVAPYRQTINTVAEMARNIDTDPDGADWGKMAAELVKVPKQDRPYVLEALSLQSPTANKPENMERVKLSFLRGMERFLDTAATGSYEVLQSAGQYSEIPLAPETPEETATRKQRESEAADYRDLRDDMRKIATGNLAPLEAVRVAGMNIAGAAEMVPMTLGAFVPYVGPAAILGSIQRETYNQLRDANPTMSRENAQSIATIAAPFQAITEVVSDRLLLGRLPNLKRAFSLPVFSAAGLAGQMSGRVALGAGVEMTEELVQGMTPLAIQSTMAALEKDVPNADWKSFFGDFAQNAPELLSQVLPLALVGAGVGQLSDYRAGKALARSPDLLVAARYTPEQAAQISEAANKGDWATAESVMRTSWAEINAKAASPAEVEANAQARVAAAERIKAIQDEQAKTQAMADTEGADYVSQVVRTPSGWEIRTGDGQVIPASSLEAAQRINADLKQTASVEEAEALVQVIDDWHFTKAAEQAETKLTGETVTGTSAGVFGLRDGKTRAFDAKALETIRQQAENIGIATDTQDVFAHVNGSNEVYPSRVAKDAKEIVKRLNLFQSQKGGQPQVITFLHEAIESSFQLGMAKGVFNEADTRKAFAALAPALDPKKAKTDEERRLFDDVRELAAGRGDATKLRETVSELVVRDTLARDRSNKRTGLRQGSLSRAIETAVMGAKTAQEARIFTRFRALLKAFSAYLRGVLSTVRQIKQAKDKGTIGEDWNAFVDKVLGLDEVTELEKQAIQEAQDITAAGNMAFSVSPITPEMDGEYLAAVEAGDMAKAQKMVDEAAKAAGYSIGPVWHATNAKFNAFNQGFRGASFFAFSENAAKRAALHKGEAKPFYIKAKNVYGANLSPSERKIYERLPQFLNSMQELRDLKQSLPEHANWIGGAYAGGDGSKHPLSKIEKPILDAVRSGNGLWGHPITDYSSDSDERAALKSAKNQGYDAVLFRDEAGVSLAVFDASQIKSADPVTRNESGNIIPLSQRFNEQSPDIRFSVSPIKSLDELSDAIQRQMSAKPAEKLRVWSQVQRNLQRLRDNWSKDRWTWKGDRIRPISEKRTKASLDAEQAMLQARLEGEKLAANMEAAQALKEAKAEAQTWRDEADAMQAEDWNPRASLIRDLVTLEAMIATLPKEIRGQVGGFVALARKGTEKARLAELQKRVEKMGVLLEKHLKEEYGDAVDKLFDKYRPEREAGKKAKGKLDPDAQEISDAAEAAMDFTPDQTSAELAKIDTLLGAENITPEEETKLEAMRELVQLMGDWKNADSARRESAFLALRDTLEEGWAKWKLKQLQKREEREEQRKALRSATKKKGTAIERDKMQKESAKVLGKANRWLLNLSSFSDVVRYIFGDAKEATSLVERERDASNAYEDAIQSMSEQVDEFFTSLGNGVLRGEQMRFDMSQPSITVGTTEFNKRELSELQGIQALLMWQQEDGKRHMEGPRDENNQPIEGKWAYDQAWIDELTSKLSPEAMQVKQFLETLYGAEYQSLNALYRERHGVNLPRHDRYAPITVKPQQAKAGEMVDPVSGAAVSGSILTPGALRSRNRSAVAEPQFRDALTTFIAHTKQMEHWKAYYDFAIDAQAVLGNREVMNAVESSVGTEGVSVLRKWVDAFAQGGTRDAAAGLEIYQGLSRLASRAAVVGLLGRFSTILVQSTQLAAASVKMPVGAYLKRLGLLLSGNLEWSDAMNSEFIQRRIKTAPPIVQQAMRALGDAKRPNQITRSVRFLGNLLSGVDGLCTSGTYAILLDYHRTMGRKMGLEGAELEAHAHREAVTATEQVAQPVRAGTRSLAEITNTSPLAKMSWAYASEARQKMALFAWSAKQAKADPAGFVKTSFLVFVVGGLMSQVLKNLWREAKGDDDEKKWSAARLTQSMFSPITGAIPGLNMLMGEGGQLSGAKYAQYAVEDLFDGEADMKDIDTILSVMGYFNDTAAGIAALSHAGYDFAQVLENAFGEE